MGFCYNLFGCFEGFMGFGVFVVVLLLLFLVLFFAWLVFIW